MSKIATFVPSLVRRSSVALPIPAYARFHREALVPVFFLSCDALGAKIRHIVDEVVRATDRGLRLVYDRESGCSGMVGEGEGVQWGVQWSYSWTKLPALNFIPGYSSRLLLRL